MNGGDEGKLENWRKRSKQFARFEEEEEGGGDGDVGTVCGNSVNWVNCLMEILETRRFLKRLGEVSG